MRSVEVVTTLQENGEVTLKGLPFQKGDQVRAIVMIERTEEERKKARHELLEHARKSTFYSTKPYPKRDELYDRSL